MSLTIDLAFIKHYGADVHEAYQRRGSKLRNTIRQRNGIIGKSTTFQKVGKGTASSKSRHGLVPVMNVEHIPVECLLSDHYAGEWVDKLDELKTNIDERSVLINAGAYALGRKTDELIINALGDATNQVALNVGGEAEADTGLNRTKCLRIFEKLAEKDVPMDDGEISVVVAPTQWSELMTVKEFSNADYVPAEELPFKGKGMTAKWWMGMMWMFHTGLPKVGTTRSCFAYHKTALGHASGAEISSDITWHGDRAAHFVNNMMSQGSVLIDNDGIVEILCKE